MSARRRRAMRRAAALARIALGGWLFALSVLGLLFAADMIFAPSG